MPEQNGSYYSRSWALLTKDRGWMKPLLVLGAAMLLPVVGFLGVQGYALEWARLTAWGVDAAPKQKDVRVGECIASGWRGFLGGVGYTLAAGIINNLMSTWFSFLGIAGILGIAVTLAGSVAYTLASLRATIYQDIAAGYAFERLWEMVRRDTDGFVKVVLVTILTSLVAGLATTLLFTVAFIPMLVGFALQIDAGGVNLVSGNITEPTVRYIFFEFLDRMVSLAPLMTILGYIGAVASAFVMLINTNAMALWVRQFDVPAWGASNDPLPMAYGLPPAGYSAQEVPYQQQMPYQQAQDPYQQAAYQQTVYQQPQQTYDQTLYQQPQQTYQQPPVQQDLGYQQQMPYQQEFVPQNDVALQPAQEVARPAANEPSAEEAPVQPIELSPIAVVNPESKNNDVENKMVTTGSQQSPTVQEAVEPVDAEVVPTPSAEEPDEPSAAEPESAPEPVNEPEEPIQSSLDAVQTESEEPTESEEQ
ncbi:MAG: DUF4013 domain-containing protein [Atopobiaceae bacterium]|nr:DUF4013 domain-containing protein [Atopobiaceae bacterium]